MNGDCITYTTLRSGVWASFCLLPTVFSPSMLPACLRVVWWCDVLPTHCIYLHMKSYLCRICSSMFEHQSVRGTLESIVSLLSFQRQSTWCFLLLLFVCSFCINAENLLLFNVHKCTKSPWYYCIYQIEISTCHTFFLHLRPRTIEIRMLAQFTGYCESRYYRQSSHYSMWIPSIAHVFVVASTILHHNNDINFNSNMRASTWASHIKVI